MKTIGLISLILAALLLGHIRAEGKGVLMLYNDTFIMLYTVTILLASLIANICAFTTITTEYYRYYGRPQTTY